MLRERELKLELDPAAAQRIAHWLRSKGAKRKPAQKMRSVYFDTDDFALYNSGTVLRIRQAGNRHTQTIKRSFPRAAGLFDRPEWETDVEGVTPDLRAARNTGLKPLGRPKVALHPVFEVDTRRSIFVVPGEREIVLTVDRGSIIAGGRRKRFCEIEIESLDGTLDALFRTAGALADIAPARLGIHSKSDRGYMLIQKNEMRIFRAGHVKLSRKMPAQDALRTIARDCLRQFVANAPATIEGTAEALHQMRVALRRLRACMSVFSELIDGAETEGVKAEFRWIGRCLGAARDLDVTTDELLQRHTGVAVPEAIASQLEQKRRQAHDSVRQALQSPRFQHLLLDALAWIECGSWRTREDGLAKTGRERSVIVQAATELSRRHRKLGKKAAQLEQLSPAEQHDLRIRAKRLRYAVEFFGRLFGGGKNARRRNALLSALKELQSTLGDLNDLANRDRLMSEMGSTGTGELPGPAAVALYRPQARSARLLAAAANAGHRVSTAKPFWD